MKNIYSLEAGEVIWLKKSTVTKYGFNPDFIKEGKRPFVFGEIKDFGAVWVVPSYSNCSDYSEHTQKYYMKAYTPNGDQKYLKFRDMIVVRITDIIIKNTGSNVIALNNSEKLEFSKKFKKVKKIIQNNRPFFEARYHEPYKYECDIIKVDYLSKPYYWLERDFNIVDKRRNFNTNYEYSKSDFAKILYYNYQINLKYFLISRNKYIPMRKAFLKSQFNREKIVIRYICYTESGFIKDIKPLEFSESITEAILVEEEILYSLPISYESEPRITSVPMLDEIDKEHVIKEFMYLEQNIVSEKTYYEIYKRTPNKREINDYKKNHSF